MTCPKCGAAIKKGQQFCPKCGAPVTGQQPDAVPGAEYVPRIFRWFWIALYRLDEKAEQRSGGKKAEFSREKARRLVVSKPGVPLWLFLIIDGMYILPFSAVLFSEIPHFWEGFFENVWGCLWLFIGYFYVSAAIAFTIAEKRVWNKLDAEERLSIIIPKKKLGDLHLFSAGLWFFSAGCISLKSFSITVLFEILFGVVISLAGWSGLSRPDEDRACLHYGLQKERDIPGWLGIFEATGEARGPEGERYVDANLSIWCKAHPAFVPVEKDCASKYSNHCILLGNRRSPIGTQEFDHILVGPGVIFHIETKTYSGQIVVVNEDQWKRQKNDSKDSKDSWEFLESPYNQARRHDILLHSIVGSDVTVIPLICLADTNTTISRLECAGDIEIVGLANLQNRLSQIYDQIFGQYGLDDSAYQETEQLLDWLDRHKVGQVDY